MFKGVALGPKGRKTARIVLVGGALALLAACSLWWGSQAMMFQGLLALQWGSIAMMFARLKRKAQGDPERAFALRCWKAESLPVWISLALIGALGAAMMALGADGGGALGTQNQIKAAEFLFFIFLAGGHALMSAGVRSVPEQLRARMEKEDDEESWLPVKAREEAKELEAILPNGARAKKTLRV